MNILGENAIMKQIRQDHDLSLLAVYGYTKEDYPTLFASSDKPVPNPSDDSQVVKGISDCFKHRLNSRYHTVL